MISVVNHALDEISAELVHQVVAKISEIHGDVFEMETYLKPTTGSNEVFLRKPDNGKNSGG